MAYAYLVGGAGDEVTLRGNIEGFARIRLRPRMLVDVSSIDTSTVLFGQTLKIPVLLAPVAYQKLIHPDGELESVRGANAAGMTFVASTSATTSVEDIAREATVAPWFQLYGSHDREFTKDLVDRARESGCTVLCFTVDAPVRGQRDRDTRVGFRLPPGIERPNFRDLNPQARRRKSTGGRPVDLQPQSRSQADVGVLRMASFRSEDADPAQRTRDR